MVNVSRDLLLGFLLGMAEKVLMQFTHNHPTGRLINSQGFYLGTYPIRVYP
jgi:hypothetical protein